MVLTDLDKEFEAFIRHEYWEYGGYERPGEWEEEPLTQDDDPFDRYAESLDPLAP